MSNALFVKESHLGYFHPRPVSSINY